METAHRNIREYAQGSIKTALEDLGEANATFWENGSCPGKKRREEIHPETYIIENATVALKNTRTQPKKIFSTVT